MTFRYRSTCYAAVKCRVKGFELYRLSAATGNEISGFVASLIYIRDPTIAWESLGSISPTYSSSARSNVTLSSSGVVAPWDASI
jgi:hypothetical protein